MAAAAAALCCIHEVLPVRSGHRVTLTFNLMLAEGEAEAVAEAIRKRTRQAEKLKAAWNRKYGWLSEAGEEQQQ